MDFVGDTQSSNAKIPQLKILVVDDDVLNQRMMQLLLTREGHQVDLASQGLEALEAVKIQKYDVVFMDLQMPIMDGIEASRRIRDWENGGQHTFIVALTASYLPEEGQVLFEAGVDNYISKPFEMEQVQRLLNYGFQARLRNVSDQPVTLGEELRSENVLDIQKGIVQVGADEEIYKELLGDFIKGLPKRLGMIQDFYVHRNVVELARAAHNLNGIASSLGASQLSVLARKLDEQSVEGYTESLDSLIQELQQVVSRLLDVSNNFLAENKISVTSV